MTCKVYNLFGGIPFSDYFFPFSSFIMQVLSVLCDELETGNFHAVHATRVLLLGLRCAAEAEGAVLLGGGWIWSYVTVFISLAGPCWAFCDLAGANTVALDC